MNAQPVTITATLHAWFTSNYSVDRVLSCVAEGDHQEAAEGLCFSNSEMDKGSNPWILAGEADITIRMQSRDQLVNNQLRSLQEELNAARAEWLTKQQALLDRISKLQALTNEVEA